MYQFNLNYIWSNWVLYYIYNLPIYIVYFVCIYLIYLLYVSLFAYHILYFTVPCCCFVHRHGMAKLYLVGMTQFFFVVFTEEI